MSKSNQDDQAELASDCSNYAQSMADVSYESNHLSSSSRISRTRVYHLLAKQDPVGHSLKVNTVDDKSDLPSCLKELGLNHSSPTLVIVGGASGLDGARQLQLKSLFHSVLVPLAQELQLHVVDGGTDVGVMSLMGQARTAVQGTFSLIGVAPRSLVNLPDRIVDHCDACRLEPNHTHCLLVPGEKWGDESPWLAEIATYLSGSYESVTVLINGGSVTWQDACASVKEGRETVIMAGSGRTADVMVDALNGNDVDHPLMEQLLSSGLLSSLNLEDSPAILKEAIKALLVSSPSANA